MKIVMKTPSGRMALILLVVIFCCFSEAAAQNSPHANSGYTPQRVYDANEKRFTDFESMLAELARIDVVFVGEQHDDPNTHRLERAILEGLSRRRPQLVVAMEMFERDVQKSLDDYLAGQLGEEAFLAASRPWPRYLTDYRPLVEFARAHRYRVVAANAPTQLARQIARGGLEALAQMSPADRALLAKEIQCPFDDYYNRFTRTMTAHPGAAAHGSAEQSSDAQQKEILERFYYAQCVKDETMAESVARLYQARAEPGPLTIHYNGAFHSDYRQGAAARLIQRMPKAGVKVLTIVPVDDLDALKPDDYRQRGDYIVFTLKPFNPSTTTGK
jgi:uncharacterized iron-regulated protein